ncbi:PstS family phosphate ABC transporter substrate-binding protein [Solitalea koreensis]|nr:substrate-binding domain-containing protein [Solitalea koreensis]
MKKNKHRNLNCRTIFILVILIAGLAACNNNSKNSEGPTDTPTSGSITISVDETFKPLVQAELDVFHATYPNAHLNTHFKTEFESVNDLLKDSAQLIIIPRELSAQEMKVFQAINLSVQKTKFAVDAIALITNPANLDSTFSMNQIRDIFSGTVSKWSQLDKSGISDDIHVVFDNANSSTVRYIKEIAGGKPFDGSRFFAQENNPDVIEYVGKHKNALGIIGVNWVSDSDDSTVTNFLHKVRVAALSPEVNAPGAGEYRKPYQAYIAQGYYPLVRNVYVIIRGGRRGLGTGFARFICGDAGQRIVLKSGLIPATMPIRVVDIKNKNVFDN